MFTIPAGRCKKLMGLQVTQYPADPLAPTAIAIREAACYVNHLPGQPPKTVMDLGCGLGRASAMLHILHGRPDITQYLMFDHDQVADSFVGGWEPPADEWCHNKRATIEFMAANGVNLENVSLHEIGRDLPIFVWRGETYQERADIIISMLAVGFHWPIEDYMDRLLPCCSVATMLIFGVRHDRYESDTFSGLFAERHLIETGWKEDVLILRGKR